MNDKTQVSDSPDVVSLNEYNLGLVIRWIHFADSKAAFLLTITLALFGASFAAVPSAAKVVVACVTLGGCFWMIPAVLLALYLAFAGCALAAVVTLVNVVKPRLVPKTWRKSPFFYQTVAMMELETFKKTMSSMSTHQAIDELADQTFNNADVALKKYEKIKDGIRFMVWSGVFGIPFIILVAVCGALIPQG